MPDDRALLPRQVSEVLAGDLEQHLELHRDALTGYCYRMLGSAFDAQDAVQEVMMAAWRNYDRFEGRSSVRTWLFSIATNVCLNQLEGRKRRAMPMDLVDASTGTAPLGDPHPATTWIEPFPDPAEQTVARESVRVAFVAALQHLPPRQRAVLVLRDVLGWKASEVADLLGTTRVSVNSALQRARATLADRDLSPVHAPPALPPDDDQQKLLDRYVDAFQRLDLPLLVSLLHEDAVFDMPPFPLWLRGHEAILAFLGQVADACAGQHFVPVAANGSPAFGLYRAGEAFGIQVLDIVGDRIAAVHTFIDPELFPLFALPPRL